MTGDQLRAQVASVAATLRDLGVSLGDRAIGYLPNTPHTIVAFLAAASLGAVWSVCGQDYTPKAAADRFAQLEPTVLFAADGYLFNGTTHDRRDAALGLARALPTLKAMVLVGHAGLLWPEGDYPATTLAWEDTSTRTEQLHCTPVLFDHRLWIVFSSGTTGLPKGIVHGHGGVLPVSAMVTMTVGMWAVGDRYRYRMLISLGRRDLGEEGIRAAIAPARAEATAILGRGQRDGTISDRLPAPILSQALEALTLVLIEAQDSPAWSDPTGEAAATAVLVAAGLTPASARERVQDVLAEEDRIADALQATSPDGLPHGAQAGPA